MADTPSRNDTVWTEGRIEALPKEDDTFDRKSSKLFATEGKEGEHFRTETAKQLSAFANSGGGSIILGVDDSGCIDGGLPLLAKGRTSTKDYLEDLIPGLTDEKILGFRVLEIGRNGTMSRIEEGKAVFVIEVPESDRAPHQSTRDHKYYVRLGSKSLPASHRIIEDIRNRARHAKLEVAAMQIVWATYLEPPQLQLRVVISIRNTSRLRAANVCLALASAVPMNGHDKAGEEAVMRFGDPDRVLLELVHSLYPGMEIVVNLLVSVPATLSPPPVPRPFAGTPLAFNQWASLTVGGQDWADVILGVTLYADSARAQTRDFNLREIDPNRVIENLLRKHS